MTQLPLVIFSSRHCVHIKALFIVHSYQGAVHRVFLIKALFIVNSYQMIRAREQTRPAREVMMTVEFKVATIHMAPIL